MATLDRDADAQTNRALHAQQEVEAYIRAICFKTGPPRWIGAELEWTVHHSGAPAKPLNAQALRRALGPYTPTTLDPPQPPIPLPSGAFLTAEPGGQLEISSQPATSLTELHEAVNTDLLHLNALLSDAGLSLGEHGMDAFREPRRLLNTPRYTAMERAFDARGPHGRMMMCSTAGLQVCLDAGPGDQLATRWAAVHALGPPLIATFANSRRQAGRDSGWASARMAAWWGIDARISGPPLGPPDDPAAGWIERALDAPVLPVLAEPNGWKPPPGLTLRNWVSGTFPHRPSTADVDFHLSTLFPPVRPRGYLEVRYLDAQPEGEWIAPVAVLGALFSDFDTITVALELATPTADLWVEASQRGLADPAISKTAESIMELANARLDRTGLAPAVRDDISDIVQRRLHDARHPQEQR